MRRQVYETDDEWRTVVVMNLVHLRRSIYELGFLIAVIALGAAFSKWWEDAGVVGAGCALAGAAIAYLTAKRDYERLSELHFNADYGED